MKKWNKLTIFLLPIGIAVNVVGGQLAIMLKLPVYLDSIGTFIVGSTCGILPGLIVAVLTQLLNSITLPTNLLYIEIGMLFAVLAHFFAKYERFKSIPRTVVNGIIAACMSTALAVPTTAFLLGGFVGTGASVIVTALMASGWSVLPATFVSELVTETMDKVIVMIIVFFILRAIPDRLLVKLPNARFFIKDMDEED
ncbi:hypothetical protein [Hespellia stercorisuis]|uniref:Energy-coupling factor transport system substrate-specific component n=1 Tax=Hespellia stercorisuis DSM 15480 TaxID=1121950 RepID=A0A1M6QK92_9FIRM|nr:hypothetical protein [Hespellia stercorisuis]SHK20694.1 energy-coupling factor transport system substrate-specific component [Hespellia stercorisuis DSM 15480]